MAHEAAKLVTAVNEAKENGGHLGSRSFHYSIFISDGFGSNNFGHFQISPIVSLCKYPMQFTS